MTGKIMIMENFLHFCEEYKIMGRFNPSDMSFSLCSPSLDWTEITYKDLSTFRPDLFPPEDPEQMSLF